MNEAEAKVKDLKLSFESLCGIFIVFLRLMFSSIISILTYICLFLPIKMLVESAKEEIDAFEEAEKELMEIEKSLHSSEAVSYSFAKLLFA